MYRVKNIFYKTQYSGVRVSTPKRKEQKKMTRTDLLNKSVDKLNSISEALELISLLNYGECIAVLMNTKNLPSEVHAALMVRAKEAHGGTTLQLVIAGMQNAVNA